MVSRHQYNLDVPYSSECTSNKYKFGLIWLFSHLAWFDFGLSFNFIHSTGYSQFSTQLISCFFSKYTRLLLFQCRCVSKGGLHFIRVTAQSYTCLRKVSLIVILFFFCHFHSDLESRYTVGSYEPWKDEHRFSLTNIEKLETHETAQSGGKDQIKTVLHMSQSDSDCFIRMNKEWTKWIENMHMTVHTHI